jgi:hypothetical protein
LLWLGIAEQAVDITVDGAVSNSIHRFTVGPFYDFAFGGV